MVHWRVNIRWYLTTDAKGDFQETLGKVEEATHWLKMDKLRKGTKYEATIELITKEGKYHFQRILYPA